MTVITFLDLRNPENGTKASKGKVLSKKMGSLKESQQLGIPM